MALGADVGMEAEVFETTVPLRWSDQDLNRHVNHARIITLLEEARIPWLFAPGLPTESIGHGAVMTDISVQYRGQVMHAPGPVKVRMWVTELKAAYFTSAYELRNGDTPRERPAEVTSQCTIAAFDLETQRPRRLPKAARDYLRTFLRPEAEADRP